MARYERLFQNSNYVLGGSYNPCCVDLGRPSGWEAGKWFLCQRSRAATDNRLVLCRRSRVLPCSRVARNDVLLQLGSWQAVARVVRGDRTAVLAASAEVISWYGLETRFTRRALIQAGVAGDAHRNLGTTLRLLHYHLRHHHWLNSRRLNWCRNRHGSAHHRWRDRGGSQARRAAAEQVPTTTSTTPDAGCRHDNQGQKYQCFPHNRLLHGGRPPRGGDVGRMVVSQSGNDRNDIACNLPGRESSGAFSSRGCNR